MSELRRHIMMQQGGGGIRILEWLYLLNSTRTYIYVDLNLQETPIYIKWKYMTPRIDGALIFGNPVSTDYNFRILSNNGLFGIQIYENTFTSVFYILTGNYQNKVIEAVIAPMDSVMRFSSLYVDGIPATPSDAVNIQDILSRFGEINRIILSNQDCAISEFSVSNYHFYAAQRGDEYGFYETYEGVFYPVPGANE